MTLKFVPPKGQNRYAIFSYADNVDRGDFKAYNDLGIAKVVAGRWVRHSNVKILENVDGDWYQLYDVRQGTMYKELPWVKNVKSWYSSYDRYRAKPMTRDEYAEWRLKVERERIENRFDISLANL
jgi:hypothetical protein